MGIEFQFYRISSRNLLYTIVPVDSNMVWRTSKFIVRVDLMLSVLNINKTKGMCMHFVDIPIFLNVPVYVSTARHDHPLSSNLCRIKETECSCVSSSHDIGSLVTFIPHKT